MMKHASDHGMNPAVLVALLFALASMSCKPTYFNLEPDDAARITYAFRRCVARKPTAEELAVLSSLLKRQAERFAAGEVDPRELAADQSGTGAAPARLASWTVLARVLLNLDEVTTRE